MCKLTKEMVMAAIPGSCGIIRIRTCKPRIKKRYLKSLS